MMDIPYSKFKSFRPYQETAINFALQSPKRFIVISAPTGSGKSLLGACIGAKHNEFTYTVHSKALQDQLEEWFPEGKVLKGRANYPCLRYSHLGLSAEQCSHSKLNECSEVYSCPYKQQKERVLSSHFKILNLPYFLTEANLVGQFSDTDLLILDEGDMVESSLLNTISLKINESTLLFLSQGGIRPPRYKTKFESWIDWAKNIITHLSTWIANLEDKIDDINQSYNPEFSDLIRDLTRLKALELKINRFISVVDHSWIFNSTDHFWEFEPVWLTPDISEQYLFRHAGKCVFMSATFPYLPVFAKLLGINSKDLDYIELPCQFPIEHRKVYYQPVANLTYRDGETETAKVVKQISKIIKKYNGVKGIIHAVSYRLCHAIMELDSNRLITHTSKNREQVLTEFKESSKPLILVSPSFERGISLDGDLARFAIWAKIPYMPLGDKVVSKRIHSSQIGQLWYQAMACQSIVQGCGRIVRSNNDWGDSWILDRQFDRLIEKPFMFPMWFREAISFV